MIQSSLGQAQSQLLAFFPHNPPVILSLFFYIYPVTTFLSPPTNDIKYQNPPGDIIVCDNHPLTNFLNPPNDINSHNPPADINICDH